MTTGQTAGSGASARAIVLLAIAALAVVATASTLPTVWSQQGSFGWAIAPDGVTIASVTIFLHRSQAHRALDLHPLASHFFRFWLWLTTGMQTRDWVAVHRKHHAKCETPEDPHSPQTRGLRTVLLRGAELYMAERAVVASTTPSQILCDQDLLLQANLVHAHRHSHGRYQHSHPHLHSHSKHEH